MFEVQSSKASLHYFNTPVFGFSYLLFAVPYRLALKEETMRDGQISFTDGPAQVFTSFEEERYSSGFTSIAGMDEVGRGPLAGPVVAAAVVFPREYRNFDIKDSKLLTADQREKLAEVIKRDAALWGLGSVDVGDIDRLNIFEASLLAMVKAYAALRQRPDCLLIDGDQKIPSALFHAQGFALEALPHQAAIVKGDRLCLSISAASILAKVVRDQLMTELDARYPQYGFAAHKGYACAAHLEALHRFGPSPAHRRSFGPVRLLLDGPSEPQLDFVFPRGGL
jgi:ribonuclease HII